MQIKNMEKLLGKGVNKTMSYKMFPEEEAIKISKTKIKVVAANCGHAGHCKV